MIKLVSPLSVPISKKKHWILNLNQYRNAYFQVLNTAKRVYKDTMKEQILGLPKMERVFITYKLFPKTKRRTDIGNVISIHKKFLEDALVELKILPDDSYEYIIGSTEMFVEVDPANPRVEIYITEVNSEHLTK